MCRDHTGDQLLRRVAKARFAKTYQPPPPPSSKKLAALICHLDVDSKIYPNEPVYRQRALWLPRERGREWAE